MTQISQTTSHPKTWEIAHFGLRIANWLVGKNPPSAIRNPQCEGVGTNSTDHLAATNQLSCDEALSYLRKRATPHRTVLMVTGSYAPDISGGGLQCRELVRALQDRVGFTVLTTVTESATFADTIVDGIPVHRIRVNPARWPSKLLAAARILLLWVRRFNALAIVHLHGFSSKSLLIIALAKLSGKRVMIKLASVGHDDPHTIRNRGRAARWAYRQADCIVGPSPRFQELHASSGLPQERFRLIPNGVDLARFRPAEASERRALRAALGFPEHLPLILFVGFFSREKHPDLLFQAWSLLQQQGIAPSGLVFVGATRSRYFEIEPQLSKTIREHAKRLGLADRLFFIERSHEMEHIYRCVDLYAMPSSREGLPNALLEAMATSLPCVATRLPGVTETLIDHGINGLLVPPGNAAMLADALRCLLTDAEAARRMGQAARALVQERYSISHVAERYLDIYDALLRKSERFASPRASRR